VIVLNASIGAAFSAGQEIAPQAEDPAHNELRALRDGLLDASKQKDVERMLTFLAEDVVIIVQNAEVVRGHDGVRDFHERMSVGDDRQVESIETDFSVDELSILYGGDTAVSYGSMNDHFKLRGGMEFDLYSRWTATLVKQDTSWKVAAFHVSTNMFDNSVSNLQSRWAAIKAGGATLVVGIACGAVVRGWWKRRQS
jgi:ketosteroid isomerase-like protein